MASPDTAECALCQRLREPPLVGFEGAHLCVSCLTLLGRFAAEGPEEGRAAVWRLEHETNTGLDLALALADQALRAMGIALSCSPRNARAFTAVQTLLGSQYRRGSLDTTLVRLREVLFRN